MSYKLVRTLICKTRDLPDGFMLERRSGISAAGSTACGLRFRTAGVFIDSARPLRVSFRNVRGFWETCGHGGARPLALADGS